MLTIPRVSVSGTEGEEDTIHQPRASATPAFKAGRWLSLASHDVVCFHSLSFRWWSLCRFLFM